MKSKCEPKFGMPNLTLELFGNPVFDKMPENDRESPSLGDNFLITPIIHCISKIIVGSKLLRKMLFHPLR